MKKLYYSIMAVLLFAAQSNFAQQKDNPWSFEAGVNYVNVYSVGEDTPQGAFLDEYFNINDHWNVGTYFAVTRDFGKWVSLTARGSFNNITKWGENANNERVFVDNLTYYGMDGMVNIKFLADTKIKPYVTLGGGYTWIEEGTYNTFSLEEGSDNLVGAGTVNYGLGLTYDITDRFGVNLQFVYKHTFKEYLTKHFQNSVGVYYNLGKSAPKEEPKEVFDADNDGVEDAHDLCPSVAGKKEFAGCPDTDGDGIPDSLDKCPNEKNIQGGCPVKEVKTSDMQGNNTNSANVSKEPKILDTEKTVYFEFNSAQLDNNAKQVLDAVIEMTKNASSVSIHVDGHTDNTGKETFNKTLSSDRANNVKGYLTANGVPSNSIITDSFGETKPKADNSSETGRALNRRAELKIKIAVN